MKKLPKVNTSKLLKAALPYILVGLMATKLGQAYRMASGGDVLDRILGAFLKIGERKPDFSPLWMESTCRGAVSRRIRLS